MSESASPREEPPALSWLERRALRMTIKIMARELRLVEKKRDEVATKLKLLLYEQHIEEGWIKPEFRPIKKAARKSRPLFSWPLLPDTWRGEAK